MSRGDETLLLEQPVDPRVDALPRARRDREVARLGITRRSASTIRSTLMSGQVRQQIDLRNQHQVGLVEHDRVLQRLVLSFGDRQHDDVGGLAEVVDGRTHEVADVLDEQVVEIAPRQVVQRVVHHRGVEVARRPGGDRFGANARRGEPPGVVVGRQIAGERADAGGGRSSARAVASRIAVLPAPGDPITLMASRARSRK